MKLNLDKILKYFRYHRQFGRNPYRDWQIMLVVSFIFCLAVIAVDGYMFYKLNLGELFSAPHSDSQRIATFDRLILEQYNKYYNTEEDAFRNVRQATSTPIDPSL